MFNQRKQNVQKQKKKFVKAKKKNNNNKIKNSNGWGAEGGLDPLSIVGSFLFYRGRLKQ